jgi:hypothetical protein
LYIPVQVRLIPRCWLAKHNGYDYLKWDALGSGLGHVRDDDNVTFNQRFALKGNELGCDWNKEGITMESRMETAEGANKMAEDAGSRLSETVDRTKGQSQELGSSVSAKAQQATAAAGETLQSLGGTIRDRGPQEGSVARAATTVANNLEDAGMYLQGRGIEGVVDDLTILIRRYPVQSLIIGVGLGYLLSRLGRR